MLVINFFKPNIFPSKLAMSTTQPLKRQKNSIFSQLFITSSSFNSDKYQININKFILSNSDFIY